MRIFATREAARFLRREGLSGDSIRAAVDELNQGLVHADLGGGLVKQRIARPGSGKRGGYRAVLAFRARERAVLLYVFPKSGQASLSKREKSALAKLAAELLRLDDSQTIRAIQSGALVDVAEREEQPDHDRT
ncbi:type II toxin-antitoxin system RelE/ParE family toxin [Rhodospira trueperi]|uniref:RelE toxin of RelE / RelB toxin-antitoxin system n=1 Tax=Rhodospira trueperi TaxID=69960 RepID=A0A1G7DH23_9PROT|nr:type II toxin-antitoxin system RelE/ParE family toxin [Rhodospira trueperi]SDE50125.1 hypothetical protein SAMN05421720_107161 [Rhodospira trueperi]